VLARCQFPVEPVPGSPAICEDGLVTTHPPGEEPHDVLAAEEFAVPAPDPGLHHEEVHDVLAAEEFAVPAPDPGLHHGPLMLPEDPSGITEPHDVLAAEEFALPAAPPGSQVPLSSISSPARPAVVAGAALLLLAAIRRRKRR
jgi:hypothetical protein